MVLMSMFLLLLVLFNAVPHASSKPIPKSHTYLKNPNNNTDNNSQNNENNDVIDASENIENIIEDMMEDLDVNGDNVLDSNISVEVLTEKEDDNEEEVKNIEKNETTKLENNADEDGSANLLFFFKTTSASPEVTDIHPGKVETSFNDSVSVSDSNVDVSVNRSSGTEEDFDLATTNVKLESSEEVSSVNETSSLIELTMKNFRDLKGEIEIREGRLRDLLIKHIGSKELLKIENLLEELDDKVIVPYENQLKAFEQQITDSKESLTKDARNYIANAEKFLQSTRDRLNEVDEKVVNFTNGLMEQAMKEFEDLKAEIEIREGHLRDLLITNVVNKDLHQMQNLLEDLEAKVIVPYENQLKTFKQQNTDSNDDALNYIASVEKFLQTSRDRLDEVDEKVATFYNRDQEFVTKTAETKSYEALLKEKIASEHIKAHDQEDDDTSEDTVEASSSIYKFLVPGLALLAFILFCLLVVYKITKKKTRAGGQISKGMVGDVGYTELDVKIDADHWDPRDGGRRYQKFK